LYASDFRYPRSPNVHCIAVSGKTKENISKLKELILKLAKTITVKVDTFNKEKLIGKMVGSAVSLLLYQITFSCILCSSQLLASVTGFLC
jgi:hypothetical protein